MWSCRLSSGRQDPQVGGWELWLDTQRHDRSQWPQIFVCLDCKSTNPTACFVWGRSLEAPSLSWRLYFVVVQWLNYFKDWDIWGSSVGILGWAGKENLSDYVSVGCVALKGTQSQLRWCECGCQRGSWTGREGISFTVVDHLSVRSIYWFKPFQCSVIYLPVSHRQSCRCMRENLNLVTETWLWWFLISCLIHRAKSKLFWLKITSMSPCKVRVLFQLMCAFISLRLRMSELGNM